MTSRLARGEPSSSLDAGSDGAGPTSPANYVPTRTELVGGVVGGNETDVVHMRLKRMAAFDSHDYDPTDNDLEEDALRGRTREDYRREQRWKWGTSVMIGAVMGVIAFVIDGLVDKLNLFRYGVIGDLSLIHI